MYDDDIQPCIYCDTQENVRFKVNPYRYELYDDDTKMWICNSCNHEIAMDI